MGWILRVTVLYVLIWGIASIVFSRFNLSISILSSIILTSAPAVMLLISIKRSRWLLLPLIVLILTITATTIHIIHPKG